MPKKKSKKPNRPSSGGRAIAVVMQQVGEQADGKIHFLVGRDQDVFNIEDGDKFFTALLPVDPFSKEE